MLFLKQVVFEKIISNEESIYSVNEEFNIYRNNFMSIFKTKVRIILQIKEHSISLLLLNNNN
jgi:hypothetical protein